jgi:hypothetical protein
MELTPHREAVRLPKANSPQRDPELELACLQSTSVKIHRAIPISTPPSTKDISLNLDTFVYS